MSNDDSHPIIEFIRDYTTDPNAHSLDAIARDFSHLSDSQRVDTLQRMKTWLNGETPTRKTAELMDLVRKCSGVHDRLRRASR